MENIRSSAWFCTTMMYFFLCILSSCEEETIDESTTGSLEGIVVTQGDNTPLPNVKVSTNPVSTTVFTDAQGQFSIENITTGEYSVQAELQNFVTAFEPANIVADRLVNVVFELDSVQSNNVSPSEPLLLAPLDGSKGQPTDVEFIWSSSQTDNDDIEYVLQLRNGSSNETQVFENLSDTTLTVSDLKIGANYFWQVTANDGINEAVQSKLGSFSVQGVEGNRFLYVRNIDGNNVIFSGSEPLEENSEEPNENEIQLTNGSNNSYRPIKNNQLDKVAFLRTSGSNVHLFTMNPDGTETRQLTSGIPVAGFRQNEVEYTWYNRGQAIYYPNFNVLYTINSDGSGTNPVYEIAEGRFISEIAVNEVNDFIALKTNDAAGYNSRIVIIDPISGTEQQLVVEGLPGALGGLDFSADGTKVLYTRDISGTENSAYRQLDTRIFEYDLNSLTTSEIQTNKVAGINTLDAKYAPNEGSVIYVSTSNDGISEQRIFRVFEDSNGIITTELLFTDANMPNWE